MRRWRATGHENAILRTYDVNSCIFMRAAAKNLSTRILAGLPQMVTAFSIDSTRCWALNPRLKDSQDQSGEW